MTRTKKRGEEEQEGGGGRSQLLGEEGPATRSRPGDRNGDGNGNGNGTTMTRTTRPKTTTCLPCWTTISALNSTFNNSEPETEYAYSGAEPTSITPTTTNAIHIGTDKYGGNDSQSRPKGSSSNSSVQRVQLLSDSEISVLDLGPSLRVSRASCTPDGEGMVQKDSTSRSSSSELGIELRGAVPITSTIGPRSTTTSTTPTETKEHAYGSESRQTSTFTEQWIGECDHCGNSCGYRSSTSGNSLVAPKTGDARMRRCKVDGAGDHVCECDCDYKDYDYDYDYGYREDRGDRRNKFTPSMFTVTTTNAISSPVLAPLKTTR